MALHVCSYDSVYVQRQQFNSHNEKSKTMKKVKNEQEIGQR